MGEVSAPILSKSFEVFLAFRAQVLVETGRITQFERLGTEEGDVWLQFFLSLVVLMCLEFHLYQPCSQFLITQTFIMRWLIKP